MLNIRGVKIEFLGHDGFFITTLDGKRIVIDPYNVPDKVGKADLILITHGHHDHCSLKDIEKLCKDDTEIVIPIDCQSKINKILGDKMLKINIASVGFKLKAAGLDIYPFPAYNIGKEFHSKDENWMGYLLKLGNVIIYHAGDTDKIPEMENLKYISQEGEEVIALLPVSGTYVMTAEEAVEAAIVINPHLAIPMHYGAGVVKSAEEGEFEDAQRFVELCKARGINAQILNKAAY
ncbi:MAG: MBL fold metallo-hydrolase [Nanoarchaeota archaeon]